MSEPNQMELKPCPFCGNRADSFSLTIFGGKTTTLVSCTSALCAASEINTGVGYWNQRAEPVRTWYSTTKEGATEKHPFKEPEDEGLYYTIEGLLNGYFDATYADGRFCWYNYETEEYLPLQDVTHFCDRYEDSPPKFEE